MKMKWFKMMLILFLLCCQGRLAHATSFRQLEWDDVTVVGKTFDIQFRLGGDNVFDGFGFHHVFDLILPAEDDLLLATLSLKAYSIGTGGMAMKRAFKRQFKHCFHGRFGCDLPASPDVPANPVPEPATMLLFGTGAIVIGTAVKRKKTKS